MAGENKSNLHIFLAITCVLSNFLGNYLILANASADERWGTSVTVKATLGESAKLPCDIHATDESDPVLLVLWYKNASLTPVYSYDSRKRTSGPQGKNQWGDDSIWGENSERVHFDTTSTPAHLHMDKIRGRDEGPYRCKVHFKSSPSWSQKITLDVDDPKGFPRIQDKSGLRMEGPVGPFPNGSVVRLICLSKGDPPPNLEWKGVSEGTISNVEIVKNIVSISLSLSISRYSANQKITCLATSGSKERRVVHETYIFIKVDLPPLSVRMESPGAWVNAGQQTQFRCQVDGAHPRAIVQWWLAGEHLIQHVEEEIRFNGNTTVSRLKIVPKAADDNSPLVCKTFAVNLVGTVLQDQISLKVHYVPIATAKVIVGIEQKEGKVETRKGNDVAFSCHIEANPPAYNVSWFHNGKTLKRTGSVFINHRAMNLISVEPSQQGLYTCVASNDEGDGQSNAVNLNVYYAPTCLEDQPREYIMEKGGTVTISCGVSAYPALVSFTWGKKIDQGNVERMLNVGRLEGVVGQYTLSSIKSNRMEVQCWAKNVVGRQVDPCVFTVLTEGRPSKVQNCSVLNHTTTGFIIKCHQKQLSNGRLKLTYNLQVFPQKTSFDDGDEKLKTKLIPFHFERVEGESILNISNMNPYFKVSGLESGMEYVMAINALNKEGISQPSLLSAYTLRDTAQTLKGMPPSPLDKDSEQGKHNQATKDGSQVDHRLEDFYQDDQTYFDSFIPPMIIILVSSLLVVILLSGAIIYGLRRRSIRLRDTTLSQEKISTDTQYAEVNVTPEASLSPESGAINPAKNHTPSGGESGPVTDLDCRVLQLRECSSPQASILTIHPSMQNMTLSKPRIPYLATSRESVVS